MIWCFELKIIYLSIFHLFFTDYFVQGTTTFCGILNHHVVGTKQHPDNIKFIFYFDVLARNIELFVTLTEVDARASNDNSGRY